MLSFHVKFWTDRPTDRWKPITRYYPPHTQTHTRIKQVEEDTDGKSEKLTSSIDFKTLCI